MGCDGGTIAGRKDLVQTSRSAASAAAARAAHVDARAQQRDRLTTCALSHAPLRAPLVVCRLGHVYNKSAVIEYLLAKKPLPAFAHVRSLKDVRAATVQTQAQEQSQRSTHSQGQASSATREGMFVCPITSVPSSGQYRFVCLHPCGCVVSENALRRVRDAVCMVCNATLSCVPKVSKAEGSNEGGAGAALTPTSSPSSSSAAAAIELLPHTLLCPSWEERDALQQHFAKVAPSSSVSTPSKKSRSHSSSTSSSSSSSSSNSSSSTSNSSSATGKRKLESDEALHATSSESKSNSSKSESSSSSDLDHEPAGPKRPKLSVAPVH